MDCPSKWSVLCRPPIRRASETLPGTSTVTFIYGSGTADAYADEASRVERLEISSSSVGEYDYLGVGDVVGVEYPQPAVYQRRCVHSRGCVQSAPMVGRP